MYGTDYGYFLMMSSMNMKLVAITLCILSCVCFDLHDDGLTKVPTSTPYKPM